MGHVVLRPRVATYLLAIVALVTITFPMQSGVRDTVVVDFRYVGLPLADTFLVQLQSQQPPGVIVLIAEAVKDKIPQAIKNRLSVMMFDVLCDVGMSPYYSISSRFNH